ncbi:PTS lactose/cellobiose transporter subunit IIA [Streptococcus azizii]|uniref:PTS lactose/cellobiose transporter subunit IIA n=1 Tax=Streptococcus azizii TaxID=1579424 RepID=A0AB36JT34_9STRE|nr:MULTISPECIES: PTS lactose/cellobiose transporter subunit IIA [Streptococcus]MBF0777037.1 PTS lactose/cellobiose transporter subunit IIA [Streptococcus sp. 19428wD3_AN2]ONK25480.1 PTS lactose/cellobiose transporter subunit IIA [Streptococcus azizii]ONK25671.1 PTS lactose/cellobiose transporter subunit IIA [Streptococcus azizii]ONK28391.1 PTS lactose/cellobiose transporter subunit IIA [Streptococcus azizii]TFU81774.1 PTS lactose/cellobiose transporter subunit IIA [Streptococcus sp. AN2]
MGEPVNLEAIMGLIMHGGDAKGNAVEAIRAAKTGNFEGAEAFLEKAHQALKIAHQSQTALLAEEAAGHSIEVSLLMVHGQDHLMNAITFLDMAKETLDLYRRIEEIERTGRCKHV